MGTYQGVPDADASLRACCHRPMPERADHTSGPDV